jgi:hypothetical protein
MPIDRLLLLLLLGLLLGLLLLGLLLRLLLGLLLWPSSCTLLQLPQQGLPRQWWRCMRRHRRTAAATAAATAATASRRQCCRPLLVLWQQLWGRGHVALLLQHLQQLAA